MVHAPWLTCSCDKAYRDSSADMSKKFRFNTNNTTADTNNQQAPSFTTLPRRQLNTRSLLFVFEYIRRNISIALREAIALYSIEDLQPILDKSR